MPRTSSLPGVVLLAPLLAIAALFSAPSCATSGDRCELNSDCLEGYCNNGTCTQDCVDSLKDCPKGYVCNTIGQCEFDGAGAAGAAGGAGGQGAAEPTGGTPSDGGNGGTSDGGSSDGGNPSTMDVAMGGQGGGTTGGDELLTLCSTDADCESGMCRPTAINAGVKRCTRSCSSNAQCPTGFRCEDIANERAARRSTLAVPAPAWGSATSPASRRSTTARARARQARTARLASAA